MEKKLETILNELIEIPGSSFEEGPKTYKSKEIPVFTIIPDANSIMFHGEYITLARGIPQLKLLIDYILKNGWETNLY